MLGSAVHSYVVGGQVTYLDTLLHKKTRVKPDFQSK